MSFLPPEDISKLRSLLVVITDPKLYQAKIDELAKIDETLVAKEKSINDMANTIRNELETAVKENKAATKELKAKSEVYDKQIAEFSKTEEKLASMSDSIYVREQEVALKEKNLDKLSADFASKESSLAAREQKIVKIEEELAERSSNVGKLENELKGKLAQLKAVVG